MRITRGQLRWNEKGWIIRGCAGIDVPGFDCTEQSEMKRRQGQNLGELPSLSIKERRMCLAMGKIHNVQR